MRGVLQVLPLLLVWPGVQSASFPVFPSLLPAPTSLAEELSPVAPTGDAVFTQQNNTELRAQVGTTAVLHCPAHNIGEDMVSWIRRRDFHLLTVGSQAYSSDDRFQVRYVKLQQDWQLHIRYVQARDDGVYECQVTSHPPVSLFSTLHVLEATSEILGGPEKYVTVGSSLRLVCVLRDNTQPPTYVFWYHHHHMINYHATRQVRVENSEGLSVLFLSNVRPADSGNYTCAPSNTRPAHIIIHVLKGVRVADRRRDSGSYPLRRQKEQRLASSPALGPLPPPLPRLHLLQQSRLLHHHESCQESRPYASHHPDGPVSYLATSIPTQPPPKSQPESTVADSRTPGGLEGRVPQDTASRSVGEVWAGIGHRCLRTGPVRRVVGGGGELSNHMLR